MTLRGMKTIWKMYTKLNSDKSVSVLALFCKTVTRKYLVFQCFNLPDGQKQCGWKVDSPNLVLSLLMKFQKESEGPRVVLNEKTPIHYLVRPYHILHYLGHTRSRVIHCLCLPHIWHLWRISNERTTKTHCMRMDDGRVLQN